MVFGLETTVESEVWKFIVSQPLGIAWPILFIVGLLFKKIVMGWQYEAREKELMERLEEKNERIKEKDEEMREWRAIALRGTGLIEQTVKAVSSRIVS